MGYESGTLLTFRRYDSMSDESYSAQENVKNKVGEPYSLIIAMTSHHSF